ncbi:hypothetical protein DZF91_28280 [Actinomadura logoneensis]|uniref:Uncharacterized protein n=1 Tax=Actinomadura logoneensis TaxID=2293572 RepID=A0A372JE97_9ACTN|nr:hypothetical protein DZF91_28280 [Actinomadura logoneensis]
MEVDAGRERSLARAPGGTVTGREWLLASVGRVGDAAADAGREWLRASVSRSSAEERDRRGG